MPKTPRRAPTKKKPPVRAPASAGGAGPPRPACDAAVASCGTSPRRPSRSCGWSRRWPTRGGHQKKSAQACVAPRLTVTISPTPKIVHVDGVSARVWEGHTTGGLAVDCFVTHVNVWPDQDMSEVEAALLKGEL